MKDLKGSIPGSVRSRCGKCGNDFNHIPGRLNSTKSGKKIPKCPFCNNYRDTVILRDKG